MKRKFLYLLVLFLPISILPGYTQTWNIDQGFEKEDRYRGNYSDLYDYVEILLDSTGSLTYNDIISGSIPFKKNNTKEGYNQDNVYWLKTTIKGSELKDGKYLFSVGINIATWSTIDVYIKEEDSVKLIKTGFKRSPVDKEILNTYSFFWLDLKAGETKTIYARLDPDGEFWGEWAVPETISIYHIEPSSIDKLDGTYLLRNFEDDSVRKNGYPRLSNLYNITQIYPDTSCNMNLDDVIKDWHTRGSYFVWPLEKNTCYWAQFKIVNPDSVSQIRVLNLSYRWQQVTCYVPTAEGRYEAKIIGSSGEQNVLILSISPQDTITIYIKYPVPVKSLNILLNAQDIYEKDYFASQHRSKYKFLLLGALFLPFLFFLIQYVIQKDRLTLYYLIFLAGSSLYLISILDQITFFAFSPKVLKTGYLIGMFYAAGSLLSFVGLVRFINSFLNIKQSHARMYKFGNIIVWLFSISAVIMIVNSNLIHNDLVGSVFVQIWRITGLIVFAYALFATIYGYFKKFRFSGPLLLAFSPLLTSGVIYAILFLLVGLQLYDNLFHVELFLAVGFIFTLVLFGVVIGVRNNAVKGEKIKMQEDMLALQENVNRQLVKVDNLKDQFLANTSHELRTPLLGIIGLSESLFEREKEQEKKQELAMIASSGKRLSSLVNSILDFSKLKTHELVLSLKAIDLRTLTDVVLNISQPLIKGKSVTLINKIDPSISLVQADEERTYQVMHNLIGNAIKFTNSGTIQVSAIEKEDMVQVLVEDTGIGIPEDKIEDIFKSFEQVDASITREHGGTGLGLTITKQLIELQGGNIRVESKVDQGTIVYFTLPKSIENKSAIKDLQVLSKLAGPDEADTKEVKQVEEGVPVSLGVRFNILIVDDESINQQVLANYLSGEHLRILQAMNGEEALKILEQEKLDLVLLDIMMPKMSGYEVCKEIRKKYLPSELPVIMITAKDQIQDLVEGLACGANDYLAKPFSRNELLARLKTHLNLYNISTAYLRFVPKEFIRALGHESIIDVALGDQVEGEMTIMFSDIRSFTSLSEKLSAKESFEFLNNLLKHITPAITSNGGFIDKYIGDAIMAVFPYKAEDALVAAIDMQKKLANYNKDREYNKKDIIKIGIGIHTGPMMMGTIGIKNRMDGTVISDAVNLASRLEELNKHYGSSLIISEDTMDKLEDPDKYNYRFLSKVNVRGKRQSNRIYEFFDGDSDYDKTMKIKTLPSFKKGIEDYYHKRFAQASIQFQEILDIYPEDKTTRILLKNSAGYIVQGFPDNWDEEDMLENVI